MRSKLGPMYPSARRPWRLRELLLKENYFPKSQPTSDKTIDDEDGSTAQDVDTTDAMRAYMSAISRNQKASA